MAEHFLELDDGEVPEFISLLRGIKDGSEVGSPDSPESIKVKYESNLNTNAFTDDEKTKLSGLEDSHFKGIYLSTADLDIAYPTAELGDYAYVDDGAGGLDYYAWNGTAWAITGDPAGLTASEIKTLYESNPDTNALTDADLALIQQNALDIVDLQDPVSTTYAPQVTEPTHQAGQVWYDANYNVIATQTDKAGLKIHIPTDSIIRIVNRTGSTIQPLTAIRNGGTEATNPTIQGIPAQSDSMFTAFVIGIAPLAILPDEEGWIISDGHIHNVDTSGLVINKTLFLSETVAGGLVQTNPKVASSLGAVLKSDASTGQLFVKIDNLIQYPHVVGYLRGQASPTYLLSAIPEDVIGYTETDFVVMGTDLITGEITLPLGGMFTVATAGVFTFASSTSTRTVYAELYNVTQTKVEGAFPINIPRDATTDGGGFTAMFTGVAGDVYKIRLYANVAMTISLDNVSFSIASNYIG